MINIPYIFAPVVILVIFLSCNFQQSSEKEVFSEKEKQLLDSLRFNKIKMAEIKKQTGAQFERFHYSLGKNYINGQEIESDPIFLNGIVFPEKEVVARGIVDKLSFNFLKAGYTIFILENNYGYRPDWVAVLHTTDKYRILKQVQTDAINYDVDNDSLIKIIRKFDQEYSLTLTGASGDGCSFVINNPPIDWNALAKEVHAVCPDVVDQGTASVEKLAEEIRTTGQLYFWWD